MAILKHHGAIAASFSAKSMNRGLKEFSEETLRHVYAGLLEGTFGAPSQIWYPRVKILQRRDSDDASEYLCLSSFKDENNILKNTCIPKSLLRSALYAMANVTSRHAAEWPRVSLDYRGELKAAEMGAYLHKCQSAIFEDAIPQVAKNYCDADLCRVLLYTADEEPLDSDRNVSTSSPPPWSVSPDAQLTSSPSPAPSPSPSAPSRATNEKGSERAFDGSRDATEIPFYISHGGEPEYLGHRQRFAHLGKNKKKDL